MRRLHTIIATVLVLSHSAGVMAQPLPDPTRPPTQGGSKGVHLTGVGPLTLSYTLTGRRPAVAIINGEKIRVGDTVGDSIVVTGIYPGRVLLRRGVKEIELSLLPADIKSNLEKE